MSGLLLDKPLLCYQPALVRRLGLAEAAIVQQLQYWTKHSTNSHDGHVWVYKTYDAWSDEIGISAKAVRGALKRLRDEGVVIAIESPIDSRDRTLWWRIDYATIDGPSAPEGSPPARKSDTPAGEVPAAPRGSSHAGVPGCSTETTTESTKRKSQLDVVEREDVRLLCERLASRVRANGYSVSDPLAASWQTPIRQLLDRDHDPKTGAHWTAQQVAHVIDHATSDPFWMLNVRSPSSLRKHFERFVIAIRAASRPAPNSMQAKQDALVAQHARFVARAQQAEQGRLTA